MTQHHPEGRRASGMTPALTVLFAVAGGLAVGNLYWAQPLLHIIADTFAVSTAAAGALVTLTQIGYSVGVFLIVPLGDTLDRRRLIPAIMGLSALVLLGAALAPNYTVLLVALALLGVTTVTGQLLAPLAGDLATDDQRGRVVGTIAAGFLTGILLSRTISGFVADAFGWRAIFVLAGILAAALAIVLAARLPATPIRPRVPYLRLLGSVFTVVARHRQVQVTLVIGAAAFSVFTMFWTGLTFLLTAEPFGYTAAQVGLVGLVGLTGAVAARRAGRLHDRGWSVPSTGLALAVTLISLIVAGLGARSIIGVLVAVLLLDIAIQAVNVLNQTRLLSVDPIARSRLNTAFVSANFIGGAIGSALAGLLWEAGGWTAVTIVGALLIGFALTVWLVERRRGLASV